jgi:hypothetical protein
MPGIANLVRNSCRVLAFSSLVRRNRTGTAVRERIRVCALARNLLCYNLYAPLVNTRDYAVTLRAFPTC